MTITISWWGIPALITLIAFYVATRDMPRSSGGTYGNIGAGIAGLLLYGFATT